jgi:hypothetical protein
MKERLKRNIFYILNKILRNIGIAKTIKPSEIICKILDEKYGYSKSVIAGKAIGLNDTPIAWYTYPAFEFIDQFDYSNSIVFEWGAGYSTLYWARVAKKVVSIEDNNDWYKEIDKKRPENVTLVFKENEEDYINAIKSEDKFDVIIIDGSHRFKCASLAPKYLNDNGFIILDNSDWMPNTAEMLRNLGLIQVDMSGVGPVCKYTWTTSIFMHRNFNFKSKYGQQPKPSIAAIKPPQDPKNGLR